MMAGVLSIVLKHSVCKTGCASQFMAYSTHGSSLTRILQWSQSSFLFYSGKWDCFTRSISTINSVNDCSRYEVQEKTVGITADEQKALLRQRPVYKANMKLLKVAIIGAPNAGKSTLLNHLINWKVSPVSEKVHTTRCKTVGILTEEEKQVVFLDTPGIITPAKAKRLSYLWIDPFNGIECPHPESDEFSWPLNDDPSKRHNLEISLLLDPHISLAEADLVVVVVDVSRIWNRSRLDSEILKLLHVHSHTPTVLVLNKVDLVKPKDVLLSVVRNLTDGVVCQRKDWTTMKVKRKNKIRIEDLLKRTDAVSASRVIATCHLDGNDAQTRTTSVSEYERDVAVHARHGRDAVNFDAAADKTDDVLPSASNDVESGRESDPRSHHVKQSDAHLTQRETNDLRVPEVWAAYYKRLSEIGQRIQDEKGWRHFDAVFMVSAVDGDGVDDLKNYLLDSSYLAPWIYHSSIVTDQNPVKLAKLVIRECLLNHLPDEIPYSIQVKLSLWEIGEDNFLRAAFDLHCNESRHSSMLLGKQGQTLRAIAAAAKQQLMNVFHREMSLKLTVRTPGGRVSKLKTSANDAESRTHLQQKHTNV